MTDICVKMHTSQRLAVKNYGPILYPEPYGAQQALNSQGAKHLPQKNW